jgi:WD40 repeat protein/serine/threonine protein kinase
MISQPKCTKCGAPLRPARGGNSSSLCLVCLLGFGLKDSDSDAPREEEGEIMPDPALASLSQGLDRYHLIEKIGEGGCGVVYRAEQLAPVRREVAIKVIKLGMDSHNVLARFDAERQALAMMDHSNIAKFFDAGVLGQPPRPYFVMELISGETLTQYCQRRQLSLEERLRLFIELCEAIQHAHQKGIIHRDLKPSNVLVVEENGQPRPKVIDFGVARATARQRLADETIYTAFDQFVGTPAYMSPEQTGTVGEDIDTRSDVYSLGVLLYELLTGRPPFDPVRLRDAALDEVCRIIREEDPPRPSTRLGAMRSGTEPRGANRPVLRDFQDDLDWVVMKALEKDRARRYDTANGFAADIRRFLAHEPVAARPPTKSYRAAKFVRRHRLVVGAVAMVALAVLVASVVSSWMYVKERAAREEAEVRAYASDMNLAASTFEENGSLRGVMNLLTAWERKPDRRGWEWHFLKAAIESGATTVHAGSNAIRAVAWSPDGRQLAGGGGDGELIVWDASDGREQRRFLAHTGGVSSVAWSPDGKKLASGGEDQVARIWDVPAFSQLVAYQAHSDNVKSIAWSPDGGRVASGSADSTVRIWDAASGAAERIISMGAAVRAMAWSPHGNWLAAGGNDKTLRVWNATNGEQRLFPSEQERFGFFSAVDWSPDGQYLAAGGSDARLRIYNLTTGEAVVTRAAHSGWIAVIAWSPDGRTLASTGCDDGLVKIWDAGTRRVVRVFRGHLSAVRSLAWRPDGKRIVSASLDGTLKIWDLERPDPAQRLLEQPDQVMSLSWHPDGRRLATASRDALIRVWDTSGGGSCKVLGQHSGWAWRAVWNPAGAILASGGSDGTVKLWAADSGAEVTNVAALKGEVRDMAWDPRGQTLAVVGGEKQLAVLDERGGVLLNRSLPMMAIAVAYSPDGSRLAAGGDAKILILDAAGGAELRLLPKAGDSIRCLAWNPEGTQLVSAGEDGLALVWDATTGKKLHILSGHSGAVYAAVWNPDGRRLATGSRDASLKIWNPATGQLLGSLRGNATQITSVAWSPDGQQLATGDLNGQIIVRAAGSSLAH